MDSVILDRMPSEPAITVSELNRRARTLLEQGIARIWVEGEISNMARPASGHIYFSLKDEKAQIRAAWFRQRQRGPAIGFKNDDKVLAFGKVSLYEPRGDYQLIVEQLEPAGEGVLKQRYEALKKKLLEEGLFDEALKQQLPALPERIGVVTSPSGAAVRDIITVLARRFPAIPVVIYPAAVQGDAAPGELVAAIETAVRRDECDVLIVGRGGGSLEDLWAFNDEALARTIAACPIPVVSAVGHEVDVLREGDGAEHLVAQGDPGRELAATGGHLDDAVAGGHGGMLPRYLGWGDLQRHRRRKGHAFRRRTYCVEPDRERSRRGPPQL